MAYIMIGDDAHVIDTETKLVAAQLALAESGIESAPVYVGEPDGLGDSHANGQVLHAAATPSPTLRNYQTGDVIRPATAEERAASIAASELDGGAGVIEIGGLSCYVD